MSKGSHLYKRARDAMGELFANWRVPRQETLDELIMLREEVDIRIGALEAEIERAECEALARKAE